MRAITVFLILAALFVSPGYAKKDKKVTEAVPVSAQPVLVITDSGSPNVFHKYITEILDAEGVLCYETVDMQQSPVTLELLKKYEIVLLSDTSPLTVENAASLTSYVKNGGSLIGLSPDPRLATVFGITDMGTITEEKYIKIDLAAPVGKGTTDETIQFHGEAENYRVNGASVIAYIYSDSSTPTTFPAVTLNQFGKGHAVCFTYDLAKSTVLFHQGQYKYRSDGDNEDPDGDVIYRLNDLVFKYLDHSKTNIPQADVQQDVLVNAINYLARFNKPLPRLWYYPDKAMSVAWITGDGDDATKKDILAYARKTREYGGYYTLFEGAGNEFDDELDNLLLAEGHSTAKHVNLGCRKPSLRGAEQEIKREIQAFIAEYGHQPLTDREHCLNWVGWTEHAKYLAANGVRINSDATSFIVNDGDKAYLNASGLPMKYIDEKGNLIDLYQQSTTFYEKVDPTVVDESLQNYHSVLTYSFHPVYSSTRLSLVESAASNAKSKGIPMVSGDSWAKFVDARRDMKFQRVSLAGAGNGLSFDIQQGSRPIKDATILIPSDWKGRTAKEIKEDGKTIPFSVSTINGVRYALFTVSLDTSQKKSYEIGFVDNNKKRK
ncbi:MAG: hypothetical protein WCU00_00740 [Candidatus Latescibacterota bacterium]